ncbi:hypothetical protein [Nocardia gipuzkoensis]|uniref:hypothetical protein n=1 Tax=Nocardia gipuzkoensis TaxID=2749991 RepID=UPI0015EEF443|nr:hypothetical protein [Nocardia gipuzkoensis]
MLNPATGCITPPGSRCKQGGYRRLDGTLDDALDALTTRSEPGFVARLHHLLAGTAHEVTTVSATRATPRTSCAADPTAHGMQLWEGEGECARLRAEYRRRGPISATVEAFARDGTAPADGRWTTRPGRLDRSAARQSVLATAVVRGYSYLDVRAQLPAAGGSWRGFADAYRRYGRGGDAAMRRDWISICRWAERTAPKFLSMAHKRKDTGGSPGRRLAAHLQQRWLAAATVWVHAQWPRSPRRWTVLAVLQALAWASAVGGQVARGVPVVEFGGRSLSLTAGDLPESTVWGVLRELRDMPGAPILRTRPGRRLVADRYALVTPHHGHCPICPDRTYIDRARVEPVHPAWIVLGLHCRRLHELITHDGLTAAADVFAAARISPSAGYNALAVLTTAGLISHTRGHLQPGPTSLDDIAHAHGLQQLRIHRLACHQRHRAAWKHWLIHREELAPPPVEEIHTAPVRPSRVGAATPHQRAGKGGDPNPCISTVAGNPRPRIVRPGKCSSLTNSHAATPLTPATPGRSARDVRTVPESGNREHCGSLQPSAQRARMPASAIGEAAHTTPADAYRPGIVEIYVESSDTPTAGGRWLIAEDSSVVYERPTGAKVASTVPLMLLRHSSSWTCVFRRRPLR